LARFFVYNMPLARRAMNNDYNVARRNSSMISSFRAQGATEYLVVLGTVLTISLVSIALLGNTPGLSKNQFVSQNQLYWKSTTPISVDPISYTWVHWLYNDRNEIGFWVTNNGNYPITITKILGGNHSVDSVLVLRGGSWVLENISAEHYVAPGERTWFGYPRTGADNSETYWFGIRLASDIGNSDCQNGYILCGAQTRCYGTFTGGHWENVSCGALLNIPNFGFEYIEHVEGREITKRMIGTESLIGECSC